jgi:hypothetical protein
LRGAPYGEQACAEVVGGQAALAEKLAQKILGREVALPRVAVEAGGNEVAVRMLPEWARGTT